MAVSLDPRLMEILACPSDDHAPLRAGTPDGPGRRRAHLHVVRPRLPGRRRHPRAAARRGEPAGGHPRGVSPGVLDDTLLADPRALAALDTGGVLRSAATAGAQVRSAAHGAQEAGVDGLRGHRPRALVLVRRPGTSGAVARTAHRAARARLPGPGRDGRRRARLGGPAGRRVGAHRGRHGRRPRRRRGARGRAAVPRWCCPRRTTARWPRRVPAGCAWSSRASRCRRGSTCRAALAVGLAVVAALELLPAPLPTRAGRARRPARRRGRAQPARPRAVHEPGQDARPAARRAHPAAVGHRPRGRGRRRPRRRGAGGARGRGGARRRHRPRGSGGRPAPRAGRRPPAGATSSTTPSPTTSASPRRRPPRLVLLATDDEEPGAGGAAAHRPGLAVHRPAAPRRRGAPRHRGTPRCCAPRCWPPGWTSRRSTSAWPPARSNPPERDR